MKIIFFGSSKFAIPALDALIKAGYDIPVVVTQPDRLKGRGLHLASTVVKELALHCGLKIYQPEKINTPETKKFLTGIKPDLFIVISYGQILSKGILDIPKIFSINVHASLLPKYRGAAPINWAVINGEKKTGVTIIKMAGKMDAGEILLASKTEIFPDETAASLEKRLSELGVLSLLECLKRIENKKYKLTPQNEQEATFAPKLRKQDGLIDWNNSSAGIYDLIRGCLDWPAAFTYYKSKVLKIYKAKIRSPDTKSGNNPAEIIQVDKDKLAVLCGKGALEIEELQIEGKKRMPVKEFLAGHKVGVGEKLG